MIVYFSGTGNSRHVAFELSRLLGDCVRDIAEMLCSDTLHCPDDRLVWVFPTYSWGVPPVVAGFMKKVTIAGQPTHHMVTTCGDDTGLTAEMWRSIISKKRWTAATAYSVQMPNTYVFMRGFDTDNPDKEAQKIKASADTVNAIARSIADGTKDDNLVKGSFAWAKTKIVHPYFIRHCMSPRGFTVSEDCISCGVCAASCPMGNITMRDGRPAWDDNCAFCTRCYHICPRHAIDHNKTARRKGQYRRFLNNRHQIDADVS